MGMTNEQQAEIRVRCEAAKINPIGNAYATHDEYESEITALLDALEAQTKRADEAVDAMEDAQAKFTVEYIKRQRVEAHVEALANEVDLYKGMYLMSSKGKCEADSRAEALERALRLNVDSCDTCKLANDENALCCDDNHDRWQFDEARFSGEGRG